MATLKLIISSKKNLKAKYGTQLQAIEKLLDGLAAADKFRQLDTRLVYVDDAQSAKKFGFTPLSSITVKNCKQVIDAVFTKHKPAYLVIFGAQDIIPFQTLTNPAAEDGDKTIPSDLPYACNKAYGKNISSFTAPVRVIGRIPDVPGKADIAFVKTLIDTLIANNPASGKDYRKWFAVTAYEWKNSTTESVRNIFGSTASLLDSPPAKGGYTKTKLKALSHFYNCHGAPFDDRFFGQKGEDYPVALTAADLNKKITPGTIVAAECCYGAQLITPNTSITSSGIAASYLGNNAISFLGSSTIAYGPSDGQGLADLITQHFLVHMLNGASAGRALLEARQQFITENGPHLDPYELKTLAQFYLLGDPSVQVTTEEMKASAGNTLENRRMKLLIKGEGLGKATAKLKKIPSHTSVHHNEIIKRLKENNFHGNYHETVFHTHLKGQEEKAFQKTADSGIIRFRTYTTQTQVHDKITHHQVMVIKENDRQILGWRIYHSK
ncbi:MAG: hypothetical protein NTU44_09540 [Bacteroidetes bacterium]|nr:hypothetical protein [Bacteroidota bacterium]